MNKRAQITAFIIIIAVVLILAIAATAIIGESTYARVRLANVADGALISAASGLCRDLNSLRVANKALFLAWVTDQITLAIKSPWLEKFSALALMAASNLKGKLTFDDVQKNIADNMAKSLRIQLYDGVLAAGLADEPEPFLSNETSQEGLNYTAYLRRLATDGSRFTQQLRSVKRGDQDWYMNNKAAYSFNKNVTWDSNYARTNLGIMGFGSEPDIARYESYLRVELSAVPTRFRIKPKFMPFFYLWCMPCGVPPVCCILPGFGGNAYGGIGSVEFEGGSTTFGIKLRKRVPFRSLPFFSRDVDLNHASSIRITGSIQKGYEMKLQE